MERSTADDTAATEVALADLPSTSGAHWANRDVRRSGDQRTPFRRPQALRSQDTDDTASGGPDVSGGTRSDVSGGTGWDAFRPATPVAEPEAAWESTATRPETTGQPTSSWESAPASWESAGTSASTSRELTGSSRESTGSSWTSTGAPTGGTSWESNDTAIGSSWETSGAHSGASWETSGAQSGASWESAGAQPAARDSAGGRPTISWRSAPGSDLTDTGSRSRASFGVTDEPISGHWTAKETASAGKDHAPGPDAFGTDPARAPAEAAMPMPVEVPARGGFPSGTDYSFADYERADHELADYERAGHQRAETGYPAPAEGLPFFEGPHGHEGRSHHADPTGHRHHEPPRRSRLLVGATSTLTALVLLGGTAAGVVYFSGDDSDIKSVLQLGSGRGDDDATVASAPLGGRAAASFELVAATRRAVVRTQDLGGDLFRITAAGDSGAAAKPSMTGDKVQLLLSADGNGGRSNVEVLLSSKVTWALRFTGGADEHVVDLRAGKVSSVDLTGASRRVDLNLPTPDGTVPLRVSGAIEDLSLASPKDSPVRVQVDSGAATIAAGKRTLKNVEPGSTLTPKDWKVPNRYDVDAESRLTLLTVRTAE